MYPRGTTSEGDNSNAIRGQPWQCPQHANPIVEGIPAANPIPAANSDRCSKCHEYGHQVEYCTLASATVPGDAAQSRDPCAYISHPKMGSQTDGSEGGDYSNSLRGQPLQSFQPENRIGEISPAASSDICFRCRELGHWAKHCPLLNARVQFNADQAGYRSASNSQPRMDHQTPTSEGDYSNALRGQPCQSLQPGNPIGDGNLAAKSDRCYRCREFGHWAKNCPLGSVRPQCSAAQSGDPGACNIPEILCPFCGGVCLILTSHTEKNPGKKFYKCPGQGAAQCKLFFQWCDASVSSLGQNSPGGGEFRRQSTTPTQISPVAAEGGFRGKSAISTQSSPVTAGGEFRAQPANPTQNSLPGGSRLQSVNPTQNSPAGGGGFRGKSPTPSIYSKTTGIVNGYDYSYKCPCGAGPCRVFTAGTDKNKGRQFVTCPVRKGEGSCGYFKWRDDLVSSNIPLPDNTNGLTPKHEGGNSGRNGALPCFNCGKEDHWKKDCPQLKGYLNS